MKLPAKGVITAWRFLDNVGRIQLDDGTELRVGASALRLVLPAAGTRVRVTKVEPHRLGGLRAVEVFPADTIASDEQQRRAIEKLAAAHGTGTALAELPGDVEPEPFTEEEALELRRHYAHANAADAERDARTEVEHRAALAARRARNLRGPAGAWGQILREAGAPPRAIIDALAVGRPSAGFLVAAMPAPSTEIASRLGGLPDVPAGFVWPAFEETSLAFLLQLRVAELPLAVRADLGLERDGVLSFFYSIEEMPGGYEPSDRGGARVFWFDDVTKLTRAQCPADLDELFENARIELFEELSLPSLESPVGATLKLSDAAAAAYVAAIERDADVRGWPLHKIGGFADEVEDAMALQCASVSAGASWDEGPPEISTATRTEAARWRLLLQLDVDESAMPWGPSGRLYVWLRDDHLRASAFEHTWCILQTC